LCSWYGVGVWMGGLGNCGLGMSRKKEWKRGSFETLWVFRCRLGTLTDGKLGGVWECIEAASWSFSSCTPLIRCGW
jgi:hypothetical protein